MLNRGMYKLVFFVPHDRAETVKEAVFATGAGGSGRYDRCSFETEGVGQFRPLPGSTPFIGSHNAVERVPELRVEVLCDETQVEPAIAAMKNAHPYEVPAFEVYRLVNFGGSA